MNKELILKSIPQQDPIDTQKLVRINSRYVDEIHTLAAETGISSGRLLNYLVGQALEWVRLEISENE